MKLSTPIASVTGLTLSFVLLGGSPGREIQAQIVPDATLPNNSVLRVEEAIQQISGGTQAGGNLFHSFEQFNLRTGETAHFDNALTIDNIITRVTGGQLSNIDGLIRANGTANLFLLNPSGIVFGLNARLDLGGSFLGSTADSLLFEDGSIYSATDPNARAGVAPPLLTVNVPVGLQLTSPPASIVVQGNGSNLSFDPDTLATIRDDRPVGLQVRPGQTLALVGGDLAIAGGNLTAEAGQLELGSVVDGRVTIASTPGGLALSYEGVETFGDIRLSRAASVDASGNGGGFIQVQARNLSIEEGASILADTLGNAPGRGLIVRAAESVTVTGVSDGFFSSSLFATVAPDATGSGGDLTVETDRFLIADDGVVAADTFGTGNAGTLRVTTRELEMRGSFLATTTYDIATGRGGDLLVEADRVQVRDGAQILTLSDGPGDSGNMVVRATDTIEVIGTGESFGQERSSVIATSAEAASTGKGGNLNIETGRLRVLDGAGVSSSSDGPIGAGALSIRATDTVEVLGNSRTEELEGLPSRIAANLFDGLPGAEFDATGGELSLETGRLIVGDGGQISAGTFGGGRAGNLSIRASEGIELVGSIAGQEFPRRNFFRDQSGTRIPSGLFTASEGIGAAGELSIVSPQLQVRDGAQVAVGSINAGRAGSLEIDAETISLDGRGQLRADNTEGLGNITLRTQDLRLRRQSQISTNATGMAVGGNITIEADTVVALENSDISANAQQSRGGRVQVAAEGIFGTQFRSQLTPDSDITATSALGTEFSGVVSIQTPDVEPSSGLVQLPDRASDTADQVVAGCAAYANSRLIVSGRGGLPEDPTAAIRGQTLWRDWQDFSQDFSHEATVGGTSTTSLSPLSSDSLVVEATGWIVNDRGQVELVAHLPDGIRRGSWYKCN